MMDMPLISVSFEKMLQLCNSGTKVQSKIPVSKLSWDNEVALFTKHILFPKCLALDRPVKCTLQWHSYRLLF